MIALTTLVGLVDAIDAEQADLAIVFGMALALSLVLIARSLTGRRSVTVRADLARWMEHRAAIGDERLDAVADRAVSAYRAGFVGDESPSHETAQGAEDVAHGGS